MSSSTSQALKQLALQFARQMASAPAAQGRKVAVLGAAGGIGQPLSMLMKVRGEQMLMRWSSRDDHERQFVLSCVHVLAIR